MKAYVADNNQKLRWGRKQVFPAAFEETCPEDIFILEFQLLEL